MNYQELMRQIKAKKLAPVYLFTGPEMYIAGMMERSLIEGCVTNGMEQLNLSVFSDKNPDVSEVVAVCETLPLMSFRRLVIVRETTGLMRTSDKGVIDALIRYVDNPSPDTVLVIYDSVPDKRKKLYKTLKDKAAVVVYNKLDKIGLEKWIGRRLKQAGKRTTQRAVEQFITDTLYLENENKNMEIVDHELNKIIDYVGKREQIGLEDVDAVMPQSVEDNIFKLVDYAMGGNKGAALRMLEQFYLEGESPFGILGLLLRQLRMMLMVKILNERHMSPEAISKEIKLAPFIVRKTLTVSRRYSLEILKRRMIQFADLDLKMKTGRVEAEFGIEWMVLKL